MTQRSRALLLLLLCLVFCPVHSSPQATRPRDSLRGVLSHTVLKPPLFGEAEVRFTPDGRYLFIQDGQGIMLISREPLNLITYISAPYSYPARFSSDSKSLILVSYDLSLAKWRVSDGIRFESHDLPIPDGCLSASLSPNGDFLACDTPEMVFALYKLDSGQKVFSWQLSFRPPPQARSAISIPDSAPVLVRLDVKSVFSSPFGYVLDNDWKAMANHNLVRLPVWFSPDSKFVIAGNAAESLRIDLTTFKKENLPSSVHNRLPEIAGVLAGERALAVDVGKQEITSFSLVNGKALSTAAVSADIVFVAQNPRFALARNYSDHSGRVFDFQANQFLPAVECVAVDVYNDVLAALSADHSLSFFHFNQAKPFLVVHLPLGALPPLHSAAVSPGLDLLAFSVEGAGGIFQLPAGSAFPEKKPFNGGILSDLGDFVFFTLGRKRSDQVVSRFDLKAGTSASAWALAKEGELHPGLGAFLEYSFAVDTTSNRWLRAGFEDVPFVLRGIDPHSGAQLWRQAFTSGTPIPFSDPQGDRFILAWKAKSEGAKYAMKVFREHCQDCKNAKISDHDTVFEIRDSRTGKSLGAVLVQIGAGPMTFSSAFSVGPALFVVKDETRVSVFSMETGKLLGHFKGVHPAVNALSNLFVLDEGGGRLEVFDLSTGEKLEEQVFADEIAYAHFSSDGKRLLVLTQHQEVFVLDMSKVRERRLPPLAQPSDDSVNQPQ